MKTYKDSIENRIKKDGRNKKDNEKRLFTVQKLCDICEIKYKTEDIGLSLKKKSINFFDKYRLGLKAIDNFGSEVQDFIPENENYNKNTFPRTLYILIHNNHC